MNTIWTIGHSTYDIETFIGLLKAYGIEVLVDVRSLPGSNKYQHFNQDVLSLSLNDAGIEYIYISLLGGLRRPRKDSVNTEWRNKSFQGYADYMETDDFKKGIKALTNIATEKRTALMCAEVLWWRCHRSMIADYLKVMHWNVVHIQSTNKTILHPYTSAAKIINGELSYKKEEDTLI